MSIRNDFALTFYFKEVFEDYDSFTSFLSSYTDVDTTDETHKYLFKYLYNEYANSNINYDTKDAFKRHFGIIYENEYDSYKLKTNRLKKIYDLTDEELQIVNEYVVNHALNNNELVNSPLDDIIGYVSDQQSARYKKNKLEAYTAALSIIRDKLLIDFIDRFRSQFIQIYPDGKYYYIKEN